MILYVFFKPIRINIIIFFSSSITRKFKDKVHSTLIIFYKKKTYIYKLKTLKSFKKFQMLQNRFLITDFYVYKIFLIISLTVKMFVY